MRNRSVGFFAVSALSLGAVGIVPSACNSTGTPSYQAAYEACVASVPKPAPQVVAGNASKVQSGLVASDENAADATMRAAAVAGMRRAVDNAKYNALVNLRCSALSKGSGEYDSAGGAGSGGVPAPANDHGSPTNVSGTNNQVSGVDEADFVKNDGHYIYTATGSALHIVEAWPAKSMREVGKATLEGTPLKLFVVGDRALVYSSVQKQNAAPSRLRSAPIGGGSSGACTYGYDCDFSGDGTATTLSLFDLTDRTHPRLVRTLKSSASLIAARRIGNAVHTVLGQRATTPSYRTYPEGSPKTEAEAERAFEALKIDNEKAMANLTMKDQLPTLDAGGGAAPITHLLQSTVPDGVAFTTVLSLDIANDSAPLNSVTVLSRAGAVYASAKSLYMAVPHQRDGYYGWFDDAPSFDEVSSVHKFAIGDGVLATEYRASGTVKGRVLNQFSMDEKDDHLRIATTTGHLPSPNAHNTLSILGQEGPALKVSGQIDNIANGEDIRSVRFDGDRGFMVTFKKTDPLYAFDLSKPSAPVILGELKIPGFSTYMHVMDKNHLLTIGYDANDHGDFAFFDGVLLQIFDVSNPKSPALVHKAKIGTRGSSSEALSDHLAFNYFVPKGALALPMTICEGGGDGSYGTNMTFSGLMVYDVSLDRGFALRGTVAHPNAETGNGYNNGGCYNWWTNASSEVKRSIFMDDIVYSVSTSRIKANDLQTLATDVAEVSIR
ncbi:beta-propeller domain-containing protein [Pendulispora brunnea]|uniref:Beta-propeller domain-containing protein n=1 Tax=Pendulispora brunnea TaxID=2905690 RepID=A0ABZ2KJ69_9BACT